MLGRWMDSPQRGDRNPPSQSIPALKGDDGQLVRICGTVTRAGPVKAGMFWKSWRSEWRRGRSHFPKASFRGFFMGFCFLESWSLFVFVFTSAIWDIHLQISYFSQILWEIENFPVFLSWPTSIIVAQKTPKKRKKHRRRSQFACDLTCHRWHRMTEVLKWFAGYFLLYTLHRFKDVVARGWDLWKVNDFW